jgi:glycosyltransferase involved in cell wall biosynthesis
VNDIQTLEVVVLFGAPLRKKKDLDVSGTSQRASEPLRERSERLGVRVSAIVPCLDEGARIERCLEALALAGVDETIVVDGGSRDGTVELARGACDECLVVPGGLFRQLNAGARRAGGDVLLFQYADTVLPLDAIPALRAAMESEDCAGGAFRLSFESRRPIFRCIAHAANLRNRLGLGPFGDQSIFVRAAVFAGIGGYRLDDPYADFELVRAIRRHGAFRIIGPCVETSTRRWDEHGLVRTMVRHIGASIAWFLPRRPSRVHGIDDIDSLRRVR